MPRRVAPRPSAATAALAAACLLAVAASPPAARAQQMRMVQAGGEGAVFVLHELGLVLGEEEGAVRVRFVLPAQARAEGCRDVALAEGDAVLMVNKKRVRTVAELEELYEGLAVGDEVKLGVRRGEELLLVGCAKADPGQRPRGAMMTTREEAGPDGGPGGAAPAGGAHVQVITLGGGDGQVRPLLGLGVLVAPAEGGAAGARVAHRLEGLPGPTADVDLREGDLIVALDDRPIASPDELASAWDAVAAGAEVALTRRRGGEDTVLRFPRPEGPGATFVQKER